MAGAFVPVTDDNTAAEWELDVRKLLSAHVGPAKKLYSPRFELRCLGVSSSPLLVRLRCHAYVTADGVLSWFVELPVGVSARYCQWVGPCDLRTRVATNSWQKAGQGWGARDYWKLADHSQDGVVKLGISLIIVCQASGPEPAGSRFKLGAELGSGSFGVVKDATDRVTGRNALAAKVSTGGLVMDLLTEFVAMRQMDGATGFPEVVGLFRDDRTDMLVMEKLHRDLESLRRDPDIGPKGKLSPPAVVEIGVQSIRLLEKLHQKGLLHRDLKPDNLMIGSKGGEVIYLVDFGLCEPFRIAGHHMSPKEQQKGLCGTARYASVHAHVGLQSRRSDLEALAYVLIYLAIGRLPWQGCPGTQKQTRYDNILSVKKDLPRLEQHTREKLGKANDGLSTALLEMVKCCRALPFTAEPDYDKLCASLRMSVPPAGLSTISSGVVQVDSEGGTMHRLDWVADGRGLTQAARAWLPVAQEQKGGTTAQATQQPAGQDVQQSQTDLEPLSRATRNQQLSKELRVPILEWVVAVVKHGLQRDGEALRELLPDGFGDAEITEDCLSDGRVLCALVMTLQRDLQVPPDMASDVSAFGRLGLVQKAMRDLGVRDCDIFSPSDLWPAPPRNPGVVLGCLLALGGVAKRTPGWDGPQLEGAALQAAAAAREAVPGSPEGAVLQVVNGSEVCAKLPLRVSRVEAEDDDAAEVQAAPRGDMVPIESQYTPAGTSPSCAMHHLPLLRGHLWKRSPDARKLWKYQWRYFVLKDMHLLWWKDEEDDIAGLEARGCLNLLVHRVAVALDESNPNRFVLRPADGKWARTISFTRGEGREFFFDCSSSEHPRAAWLEALSAHAASATQVVEQVGQEQISTITPMRRISYVTPDGVQVSKVTSCGATSQVKFSSGGYASRK